MGVKLQFTVAVSLNNLTFIAIDFLLGRLFRLAAKNITLDKLNQSLEFPKCKENRKRKENCTYLL